MAKEKKAPAKKKAQAKKKEVVLPPNPENSGAVVRTITCDKARAAKLVKDFGFCAELKPSGEYLCTADLRANKKYEEANA